MNLYFKIIITFGIGFIGWKVATKLKMPAPSMIGSLIFVGLFNVIANDAYMPSFVKIMTQSIAGGFLGLQFKKNDFKDIIKLIKSILLLLTLYTINTFFIGVVIHYISHVDLQSSLFACIPGGIADISLIAMDLNADLATIVFLQSMRLILTLGVFPYWISFLCKHHKIRENKNDINLVEISEKKENSNNLKIQIITYIISFVSGYIGSLSNIPAGTIIFSLISVCVVNNFIYQLDADKNVRTFAQVFSGSLVGSTITLSMVLQLEYLFLPIIVLMCGYLIVNYLFSLLSDKLKLLDFKTALFCACPTGVSDMVLLSGDLGANMKETGTIHIARLLYSVAIMPSLIVLITDLI